MPGSNFPSALEALSFRFDEIVRLLSRRIDAALADHDLSRTQWRLLAYVLRQEGITQSELARVLELERASVGNTVDIANATWTNTIGAPELISVWQDPDFDAKLKAFYYVRVIEIPTPRWTAYDAKRFGVKPLEGTRMTITERAYTSPVWYNPG